MPPTIRFAATCAAVLLVGRVASAQVEVAPRPHPTLDDVVKEYQRLGLRLPPPDAELVRIEYFVRGDAGPDEPLQLAYKIGFKLAPSRPGKDPRYLIGSGRFGNYWIDPLTAKRAEPTPDALSLAFDYGGDESTCFAVQCELRGWHELAKAAYARAIEFYTQDANLGYEWDVLKDLQELAWDSWELRLTQRGSDRKEILKQLKKLAGEYEHLRNPANGYLLSCLESTIGPRKTKPGTVESLIDDLTEHWGNEDWFAYSADTTGHEAYWKLVELGFDAVPALIDHLNDDRLSRACVIATGTGSWTYRLTVGHLCSRLLFDLSARTIGGGYWAARGDRLDPAKAREWFAKAQKIGEEKWLLDHAIPEGDPKAITNQTGRPERLIVRVIGAKYPARLPAIYRAMLKKKPSGWNDDYVDEIRVSKLPREQKFALFEEGAAHDDIGHRLYALQGLAGLDQPLFRKHLVKTLNEIPTRQVMSKPWSLNSHSIVPLLAQAGDRACWDALAATAKKATADDRVDVIRALLPLFPPDEDDPIRRERLRFLILFLDDRSLRSGDEPMEVRDYAANLLANLLRFPGRDPEFIFPDFYERDGALTRLFLREAVRQAAAHELARDR